MKLSSNTILITGATSGPGLEMARRFHALGNKVIAVGSDYYRLQGMEGEMEDLVGLHADLSDPYAYVNLASRIHTDFPDLNVIIHNMGDLQVPAAGSNSPKSWASHKLRNLVQLTEALLPQLKNGGHGAIMNVMAGGPATDFNATRKAIQSYTDGLRHLLEGTPVSVYTFNGSAATFQLNAGTIEVAEMVDEITHAFRFDKLTSETPKTNFLKSILDQWMGRAIQRPVLSHS